MAGNEYNDLWIILQNVKKKMRDLLPPAFIEFVRSAMDPDEMSAIDPSVPLTEQAIPEKTSALLGALYLTYWAESASIRREFAERLHRNEQIYEGKEPSVLTEEEYQNDLEPFDIWNELFGLIPYWAESRGWHPQTCYEITLQEEEANLKIEGIFLKEVYVSPEDRASILEEAKQWVLAAEIREEEELYWHDNDTSAWSHTKETEDFCNRDAVLKDGRFYGALIHIVEHWGMGMASHRDEGYGILCIDGTKAGKTKEYESRSSDESSYEKTTSYSLKKKTGAQD